jgi:hypothetical protein
MIKKALMGAVASLAAIGALAGSSSEAEARSVTAATGDARVGSQSNCFYRDFSTGAVGSTCNADFLVGLVVDTAGAKTLLVTARATAAGASCRAVGNNRFGTALSGGPWVNLAVNPNYVNHNMTGAVVPAAGVLFLDCVLNNGASVNEIDYVG